MNYNSYHNTIIEKLSHYLKHLHPSIQPGIFHGKNYQHILPLANGETKNNKRAAIKKYLGIDINEFIPSKKKDLLHPYAHHLNSSQLLCYMVFRPMLNSDHTPSKELIEMLAKFDIKISPNAKCSFEYNDNMKWNEENEGTSFDFYICDNGREYFFEIKFTENGFGSAKNDAHHQRKIEDFYIDKIKNTRSKPQIEDVRAFYQLFRNYIRNTSKNTTVIFITDKNNPSTKKDIENFRNKFLYENQKGIMFITWQDIVKEWPKNLKKPFQLECL